MNYDLNIVVSNQYNFTIYGSPQLVQLSPEPERGALQLNGMDQRFDMSALEESNCLRDPANCVQGFSLSFNLKVQK